MEVEIHHIIPWETCKTHDYDNLIALCPNCHRSADSGKIDRKALRIYKANLRFTHDKFSQFEVDTLFATGSPPSGEGIYYPAFAELLIKRLLDSDYVQLLPSGKNVVLSGVQLGPSVLMITDSGRKFLESLEVERDEEND